MLDIILIGSGPSSLITDNTYFSHLNLGIICKNLNKFHCTYGIFDMGLDLADKYV